MKAVTSPLREITLQRQSRQAIIGSQAELLTDIYRDDTNIVVWQRRIAEELIQAANYIVETMPRLQTSRTVTPENAHAAVSDVLGASHLMEPLCNDIARLVDMFCCLFDLKRSGLRLITLDRAMCPRFHVDRVPCRLVTTYQGEATQWLPHHLVDRSKLGAGNQGKSAECYDVLKEAAEINQLSRGDVALLKGELWQGNENAGLVHRSPQLECNSRRLLLTLDFAN